MGKPGAGRQKRRAPGRSHALVESGKGSQWATKATAGGLVEQGGAAVGAKGAPRLRSRIWHRSLALASVDEPGALCRALEERQQAHRRLRARAQSLGDCARQTALGRGATALGYPFPCLSQHAGARLAGAPPRVSWPLVVGRGATRQRARTLVSAHQ